MTEEAANHNMSVLANFNFDIQAALQAQFHSPVGLGSEFREPSLLEPLLIRHPFWPRLKSLLIGGAQIPRLPISDDTRAIDLAFHHKRGNHKSAIDGSAKVFELLSDDVIHGYSLPLPLECLPLLPRAALAPLGLQLQSTVDEFGNIVPKYRMCHDQTFPGPSGLSLNKRTLKDQLPPCLYGRVHLRMSHYIVSLRWRHPSKRILIGKFDIKAAYHRAHLDAPTAMECLTTCGGMLFASLRYTFGGAAFQSLWSCYSEVICDLSNDLFDALPGTTPSSGPHYNIFYLSPVSWILPPPLPLRWS
jgi:hypothetical protein